MKLAQHIARITTLEGQGLLNADVVNDNKINISDLMRLAQYIAQIPNTVLGTK